MPENGVLQIYTANETANQNVWFDDLKVTFSPQLIVQENHYYPFGMELSGLNKRNKPEYRWKFQGQEEQKEFGLNWSSFKWRNADVALGRFFSVDPLAEQFYYNSTYAFSENKVTSHVELEGLESVKKNEQAQITKVVKHGSKAIKRLRPKGSGGGSFFPSSTPHSGDAPRNNIFPGNYTIGPNLTKAEREHYRKFGENLNFKILDARVNGGSPKNSLEDLPQELQDEYLILEGKGVGNLKGDDLVRFRELDFLANTKGAKTNKGNATFGKKNVADEINKEIIRIALGQGTPRYKNDGSGDIETHDGKENPAWKDSEEYEVPSLNNHKFRILRQLKTKSDGTSFYRYGWTDQHYAKDKIYPIK